MRSSNDVFDLFIVYNDFKVAASAGINSKASAKTSETNLKLASNIEKSFLVIKRHQTYLSPNTISHFMCCYSSYMLLNTKDAAHTMYMHPLVC